MDSLSLPLTPSHPYVCAVPGVLWTTEQIVGRFIGETVRQLGTHHKAKQMFRWLGEEVNGKECSDRGREVMWKKGMQRDDRGSRKKWIYWCKNPGTSLPIHCQPPRWAKRSPLSCGHRSLFQLPYWFAHKSVCCRSNAFDLLIISA